MTTKHAATTRHGMWVPYELMDSGLSKAALWLLFDMTKYDKYFKSRKVVGQEIGRNSAYVSCIFTELEKRGLIEQIGLVYRRRIFTITEKTKKLYNIDQDDNIDQDEAKLDNEKTQQESNNKEAEEVFYEVNRILGGGTIKFTQSRKSKVKARLKEFTKAEIIEAAEHLSKSSWHMGKNDNHKKYATPDFLFRSYEQVEKWRDDRSSEIEQAITGVMRF